MIEFDNTAIVITARMAAPGLPGRPMLDVWGRPLVVRAWARAVASNIGPVLVAAGDNSIAEAVRAAGGDALVAPPLTKSEAEQAAGILALRDGLRQFQYVIVLPCQLLMVDDLALRRCLAGLMNIEVDVATLAAPAGQYRSINVVAPLDGEREVAYMRDLSQQAETGYSHVPVYAYRRSTLERFAALPAIAAEKSPGMELSRALAAGMKVAAVKIDSAPLSVDTPEALEALRRLLKV